MPTSNYAQERSAPLQHPVGPWLTSPRGWQLNQWQLKVALGLNGDRTLPADFSMAPQQLGNVKVYIRRRSELWFHRVMVICPCGAHLSAGRLHQHRKGQAHKTWEANHGS